MSPPLPVWVTRSEAVQIIRDRLEVSASRAHRLISDAIERGAKVDRDDHLLQSDIETIIDTEIEKETRT